MPNPNFLPIIGSGPNAFSDIGAQQAGWARFNSGIEENNIARARDAQREANNWYAQLAQWQRLDEERARQDQLIGMERADRGATAAERRREFDVGTRLSEKQMESDKEKYNWHFKLADAEQKRQLTTVENTAKFLSKDASDHAERFKDTVKELREATAAIDTSASSINRSGNIVFKNKQFMPAQFLDKDPEALRESADANSKLASDKARYDQAVQNYQLSLSNLNELRKRASNAGLEMSEDGTIYSPFHDKTFGSKKAASVEASAPETETGTEGYQLPAWLRPIDMSGMGMGNSMIGPSPITSSPAAAEAPRPQMIGGGVKKVVRGPDGKLVLVPASRNAPAIYPVGPL